MKSFPILTNNEHHEELRNASIISSEDLVHSAILQPHLLYYQRRVAQHLRREEVGSNVTQKGISLPLLCRFLTKYSYFM